MAEQFNALREKIRMWSNRDVEALPDPILEDTMMWAADMAYRTLRVPPLENTFTYDTATLIANTENQSNLYTSQTRLPIPGDLIEFIQIRAIDPTGATTRVFNEKADVRTFQDYYAEKYSDLAFWTRMGPDILLRPGFRQAGTSLGSTGLGPEDRVELYYYRRLPALDARYDLTVENGNEGFLTQVTDMVPAPMGVDTMVFFTGVYVPSGGPTATMPALTRFGLTAADLPENMTINGIEYNKPMDPVMGTYYGNEVPNWLRDENERIIIFGALAESFAYLQEDDQAQKYMAKFHQEIAQLNDEDVRRNASGGNVQVNFNGRGLI